MLGKRCCTAHQAGATSSDPLDDPSVRWISSVVLCKMCGGSDEGSVWGTHVPTNIPYLMGNEEPRSYLEFPNHLIDLIVLETDGNGVFFSIHHIKKTALRTHNDTI